VGAEDTGKRLGQGGLGDTGNAFEQDMPAGQQSDHELVSDLLHADDDLADLGNGALAQVADLFGQLADVVPVGAHRIRCHVVRRVPSWWLALRLPGQSKLAPVHRGAEPV